MNFDETYNDAFKAIQDVFAETVEYYMNNAYKTLSAIIDRDVTVLDSNDIPTQVLTITISGNTSDGVPAYMVDEVEHHVVASKIKGDKARPLAILEVQSGTGGVTTLICR